MKAGEMNTIFDRAIADYHRTDSVDQQINNPFPAGTLSALLYQKNWIDTVQWHLEDIIRRPDLAADTFIATKRRIDTSNQARTDLVERIDDEFLQAFGSASPPASAPVNTETPAWAVDRLSILALKIYHMREEANRADASPEHRARCQAKLSVLEEQRGDLSQSLDELLADIEAGRKRMKVYRQMKMYNDNALNPQLYRLSEKRA